MGIKIGMVGVGQFAHHFISLYMAHPLVSDVALCDLDPKKLEAASRRYGLTRTFPSLDAIPIATSTPS